MIAANHARNNTNSNVEFGTISETGKLISMEAGSDFIFYQADRHIGKMSGHRSAANSVCVSDSDTKRS